MTVMEKIYFDRRFLYGLYLYVRQIELSVDRAFGDDWQKLVQFFSDRTPVDSVLAKLLAMAKLTSVDCADRPIVVEQAGIWRRILSRFLPGGSSYLTIEELQNICGRLKKFSEYLQCASPSRDDLVRLRMDLFSAERLIERRIAIGHDVESVCVEHFNQNLSLPCRPLQVIIGHSWPD